MNESDMEASKRIRLEFWYGWLWGVACGGWGALILQGIVKAIG